MKRVIIILTLSCVCVAYHCGLTLAQINSPQEKEILTGKEYFDVLHRAISESSRSIDIQMYFIIADPRKPEGPISILVEDLIKAKQRGISVRVILEDSKFRENHFAYKLLTREGIEVNFDGPGSLLHSKVIVIDGKTAILGSANWSRAAIYDNHEVSILIRSEEICEELLNDFARIRLGRDTPVLPQTIKGVNIPQNFLLSEKGGRRLIKNRAEYAFDLYLLLLRKSHEDKSATIPVDFALLKKELGCKNIRRPRFRLDKTYNLIRYNAGRREVTILDLSRQGMESAPLDIEHLAWLTIPFEYWEYGFDERLSLRTKYMYLVALLEAKKSTKNPYWFRSQEDMAKLYGVSDYTTSLGLQELEKENIVQINRSIAKKGEYGNRKANIYSMIPLISPQEFKEKMDKLITRYGKKMVARAQALSEQLNKPKDFCEIETFIHLIQKFGYKKVRQANDITARMKKGSGLRDISYTIGLLKGE